MEQYVGKIAGTAVKETERMLGAIVGDIVGSRFEWDNHRSKEFDLLTYKCFFTDDSVMSLALAQAILESKPDYSDLAEKSVECMQRIGRKYPDCGYGGRFYGWMFSDEPKPYNSFGNGAAMRVSAAGFAAGSMNEAKMLAERITAVTHNHPEGVKGAEATGSAIFLAREGSSKEEIKSYIVQEFGYDLSRTLDEIRPGYSMDATCQGSVPEAILSFLESTDFEDAVRGAVSLGGDTDTIACIAGSIAEAFYGVPETLQEECRSRLPQDMLAVLGAFDKTRREAKRWLEPENA